MKQNVVGSVSGSMTVHQVYYHDGQELNCIWGTLQCSDRKGGGLFYNANFCGVDQYRHRAILCTDIDRKAIKECFNTVAGSVN